MTYFELLGYRTQEQYSKESKTSLLFALTPSGSAPPSAPTFRPIIMFF